VSGGVKIVAFGFKVEQSGEKKSEIAICRKKRFYFCPSAAGESKSPSSTLIVTRYLLGLKPETPPSIVAKS